MKVEQTGSLGLGKDCKAYPRKYTDLKLWSVWKIDNPELKRSYEAEVSKMKRDLGRASKALDSLNVDVGHKESRFTQRVMLPGVAGDRLVGEEIFLHGTKPEF